MKEMEKSDLSRAFCEDLKPRPFMEPDSYDKENLSERMEILFGLLKIMLPGFVMDHKLREIYENAILYFNADHNSCYNLNKGLLLYGEIGNGKTTFFRVFKKFTEAYHSPNSFRILSVNDLIDGYSMDGNKFFIRSGITFPDRSNLYLYPESGLDLVIDDFGQSSRNASHFGNTIDVVADTIARRYCSYVEHRSLTHISTNVPPSQFEPIFGKYVASRLREMMNIIKYPGTDKRK